MGWIDILRGAVEIVRNIPDWIALALGFKRRQTRKKLLRRALGGKYDWRKLSTLTRMIGQSEDETRELLIEIGARGSVKPDAADEMWGLVSRVGGG
jgi:hypothetical protein